jgi:hypothetical protein
VTRAVHCFKGRGALVNIEDEHIILIVVPMTRGFPELGGEKVGRDDFKSRSVPYFDVKAMTYPQCTLSFGTPV